MRVVVGVEAGESQVPREPTEMTIEHESRDPQRLRPDLDDRRDVERLEPRIHTDPVAVTHVVPEVDRVAVDDDEIDLGMGHADALDHVFHRR